jgi:hypothetical protein
MKEDEGTRKEGNERKGRKNEDEGRKEGRKKGDEGRKEGE